MKYAFIVLIAIYLVIYGCSPDNSEKATDSHKKTAPTTVETSHQSEMVAVPEQQEKPAAPTLEVEHPAAEVVQEPQAVTEPQPPTEMDESQQIVMPCGRMMDKEDIPANAPCLQQQTQPQTSQDTVDKEQELTIALQKMMETTNNMVLATQQLVIATHEMLNAGKGKESMETPKETKPDEQSVEEQVPAKAPEKDVIQTMKEVVSAAQELIDATNATISAALEPKKI